MAGRRRLAGWFVGASTLALGACTLLSSLDGYTGPAPVDGGRAGVESGTSPGLLLDASEPSDSQVASDATVSDAASTTDARLEDAPSSASARYRDAVLADGPLAYWRLGEVDGVVARDERGAYPGTYLTVSSVRRGVPGIHGSGDTAVELNTTATSGRISFGDVFDFVDAAFSVELWVAPRATTIYPRILTKERYEPQEGYHLELGPSGRVAAGLHRNDADRFVQSTPLPLNVFTHLVLTYDRTTMRLYEDGDLVGTDATPLQVIDTATPFMLGCDSDGQQCVQGVLDEVAVYGKVLSAERIAAHHAAGRAQ